MKYIDLFSGIGGFHLGFEQAGLGECVWANDWSEHSAAVYKHRFPNTAYKFGDITSIDVDELPSFDLLAGGFPCQAFSLAGKRRGFEDTRGTLFFEIARILEAKRPRLVLLENVKGLLSHDDGETFRVILETMDELGYWVEWSVLNSKNFGVPQNRERVFIVGHFGNKGGGQIFPLGQNDGKLNKGQSYISSCLDGNYHKGSSRGFGGKARQLIKEDVGLNQVGTLGKDSEATRVYSTSGLARTIKNGGGMGAKTGLYAFSSSQRKHGIETRIKEGEANTLTTQSESNKSMNFVTEENRIRRLTPRECERLQGFPDDWTLVPFKNKPMSDSARYKMLGNAVTVNVIQTIGESILEANQ